MKSFPGNNSIAYSGYMIPSTGELIATKPGWFNYQTVTDSFKELLSVKPLKNRAKYLMVLDNAPWHKKALRLIKENKDDEYDDIREAIEFISLPPYSSDLNPIEQVWRLTRRSVTHNRYYPTLEKLVSDLDAFFDSLSLPNEKLKNLCGFCWLYE